MSRPDLERHRCHDVVGLGFGPANLALAVALDEAPRTLDVAFLERQESFGWHRDMLVPAARMQVSFLKDLATFRNPTSRFGFVPYLHARNRLARFVNRSNFFPTRQEFHDYLDWAAAEFTDVVSYGARALRVRLPEGADATGEIDHLVVDVCGSDASYSVRARNIVISMGLVPRLPAGVVETERVWHSAHFLRRFAVTDTERIKRVAVIGGGQSAAELVRFLYDALPAATVYAVTPAHGYAVADNSPFVNEIFDASAVDTFYASAQQAKDVVWRHHRNTNYAAADDAVIRDLYDRAYDEAVDGSSRLEFLALFRLARAEQIGHEVTLRLFSLAGARDVDLAVDLVVCATGYDEQSPAAVLGDDVDSYCERDTLGRHRVARDYSMVTSPQLRCGIYLQGGTENTHGISSSLLSNLATRSGDITDSILARTAEPFSVTPVPDREETR